jgi:putative ABC transport system permease protein
LLALSGGVLGMLVAWLANKSLIAAAPVAISRFGATSLDWRVLSFAVGVSLSTGILFGLFPAVRSSSMGAGDALHSSSSRNSTSTKSHRRVSGALIVAETALSLMLLFAAGLLIASFLKLQQLNPGFNYRQLATFETTLSVDRYGSPASLQRFLQDALQRIQKLPGVGRVASVSSLPTEPTLDFPFTIAGGAIPPPGQSSGDSDYLRSTTRIEQQLLMADCVPDSAFHQLGCSHPNLVFPVSLFWMRTHSFWRKAISRAASARELSFPGLFRTNRPRAV